jgi:general secretion pathway protein B
MSFILDALKKSEVERQRQSVPGYVEVGVSASRPRLPPWAIALAVLLGVNLIAIGVVLLRSGASAQNPPHSVPAALAPRDASVPAATTAPTATTATTARPEHFSPLDTAPVYAPEIPVAAPDAAGPGSGSPGIRASTAQPKARAHRADPLLTDTDGDSVNEEVLPSVSELNLAGADALPDLHIDVHVYATKASDRFVYINMRKYREGASLEEGPVVEHIRRDGVVLNYHGLRFLLPRQQP